MKQVSQNEPVDTSTSDGLAISTSHTPGNERRVSLAIDVLPDTLFNTFRIKQVTR